MIAPIKRKRLFFPRKLINEIVLWISGIHSPTGTVKCKNTMEPGEDGSLQLDVNMEAVRKECMTAVDERPITTAERDRFDMHLRGKIDGTSLIMKGAHVSVSDEWVENKCREFAGDSSKGPDGEVQTPEDHSDQDADDYQDGATWTWQRTTQAGGSGAGLIITPYCEIEEDTGYHFFARVKLTFDQSGALVSAEALPGRKLIQA